MKKIIILALFLLLLIAACSDEGAPTSTEFENTEAVSENAPRAEAPTPTMLPATYTPSPMEHDGHLFLVGGFASGTRIIHVVQPGDTLTILCERYGVSVEDLARINNIHNVNHIEVGDSLIIPLPRTDS